MAKLTCSREDTIEILELPIRVLNALRRGKIKTIGALLDIVEKDGLWNVRNLGEKGIAIIGRELECIEVMDAKLPIHGELTERFSESGVFSILVDLGPPTVQVHKVVKSLQLAISRQIRLGLLHADVEIDGERLQDLVETKRIYSLGLYAKLLNIITSSQTLADEIETLIENANFNERDLAILQMRFGYQKHTLQAASKAHDVSRERIRQIESQSKIRLVRALEVNGNIRIQSAVLFAEDMNLSFNAWSRRMLRSGLLGDWTIERFVEYHPIEMMIAICRITEVISLPQSLNYMIGLHQEGKSNTPSQARFLVESLPQEVNKLVQKHLHHSGAVSVEWLTEQNEIPFSIGELPEVLEALEYSSIDQNWFLPNVNSQNLWGRHQVFHRSLRKMFQYCGPLSVRDIYFGIERTLVKTDFPIPPFGVVEEILRINGYAFEVDIWYWPGDSSEKLNAGETAIRKTIYELGGVAHHSELMQAILDSGLSGTSLHATLRRSPLFDNFDQALYKLRGTHPRHNDIERAQAAANKTPVDLSVERDTYGNIAISANLGILAIANGTIVSERIPNLEGAWQCMWSDIEILEITVTHNEIRGLLDVMRCLDCELGDRISLTFNVLDRTVAVRKIGEHHND